MVTKIAGIKDGRTSEIAKKGHVLRILHPGTGQC